MSGRIAARTRVSDDKKSDEVESGVIFMLFSQSRSNDSETWTIEITTPERNRVPTQKVKGVSTLMKSIMSEVAETAAVLNITTMQDMKRPSILGAFCSGRRESCEAKAALTPATTAMARLSATARIPQKIPKESRE